METNSIEHFNKQRFNNLKLRLLGWVLFFISLILRDIYNEYEYEHSSLFDLLQGAFGLIMFIGIFKEHLLNKKMKQENKLEALNDEFLELAKLKSYRAGYFSFSVAAILFMVISHAHHLTISLHLASATSLFIGFSTQYVSLIIYNKD